ncbi:MAG: 50S ribosomal protein L24 [Chromatiales bacterium]|jgi:large subunit ribosomal protein L24|nr:50S ribosomal protein L24 [Chromatiales bacterium]MDH3931243.1 50S ribosomal protein L24 [Chromatiales bacterium]MDH3945661.1 50S ribosomal protein L24 [Chromatiales bacterium]MDH4015165.1 50S ribosomal protein L24 [Chromatiales bacterium]PLX56867.1 MAG: 50S ribosomal protein L24 [Chromatiales bacterium]
MQRIRKGDEVVVIAGRDKGRRGTVVRVLDDERIVVENINIAKKHQKPNPNAGVAGGIVEIEMPLDASNVMLWNPVLKKGDRVGFKTLDDGRKVRVYKSDNEVVDV